MSLQLRESMKALSAAEISAPMSPRSATFCSTHSAALLITPWVSSTWVITAPPGTSSISARRMLAAVLGVLRMLIGLKPSTSVSIRKPGMMLALSAK